ncbi:MAG: pseudaminic acid cytidylyltransferase [Flavobacteriaceae bacterium]|nr:pseudaminic acid cytidylyltransferase [Flavobacteriaceae bacterium]
MARLAIIPARGGSKRIPDKNSKLFSGKPIITYSIEAAVSSGLFDEVMVSTDDEKIATIAKEYGAKVPFFRSEKNADDFATLADVVTEVLASYQELKQSFDTICCLLPTAPFVTPEKLQESLSVYTEGNYDSVFPVLEFSYPIQRGLRITKGKVSMINPKHELTRSQDLELCYHDSGQFYWLKTQAFLQDKKFFTKNSGTLIISELEAQDIDTATDWKLAELKYNLMINK